MYQGKTTGDPLAAVIWNKDVRSADYEALAHTPRPSHGDYAAAVRAHGCNDPRGGGHTSGRLTAPLTAAGALALPCLAERGIAVRAEIVVEDGLRARAAEARREGDSVGGVIRCTVTGLPAGLGGPDWRDNVESEIARHVFAIPAVKAVGFGAGEDFAALRGSEANDPFTVSDGAVRTVTNRSGGVNAGITNGMDVVVAVTFRPAPSIAKPQQTGGARLASGGLGLVVRAAVLSGLFARRQALARRIGGVKREQGLPVCDPERERQVLASRGDLLPERRRQVERLFALLMELSREAQT